MNATLEKSFELFTQRISLTGQEIEEALERADEICNFLSMATPVKECKVTGSMARSTAIRKFSDVDVVAVLRPHSLTTTTPQSITEKLLKILKPEYRNAQISENTVHINFTKGPDVDVIPAVPVTVNPKNGTTYRIPSPDRGKWNAYDPEGRNKEITQKGILLGDRFVALIKVIKWWSKQNGQPIASYEIENIASASFTSRMPSVTCAIVKFFDSLESQIEGRREDNVAAISAARAIAKNALRSEQQGDAREALNYWGSLLGDQFSSVAP
ncbi:SMODS domain-containing nucleotidyltransferase [Streptomyces sediminimaris]|uniref:SMODS domain-containing nucleotidyltransferase n=1 Tax=Streptomyces sediminimaris TaxID=3383721 RepID=UPI00399A0B9B